MDKIKMTFGSLRSGATHNMRIEILDLLIRDRLITEAEREEHIKKLTPINDLQRLFMR